MKLDKTEVILILDRSGSMHSIKSDIEGGLKAFIEKQVSMEGECYVSLYQFDDKFESVFQNRNILSVGDIPLNPRGNTALFDAIGKSTNLVGERLASTPEKDRPAKVIVVVLTDGYENASKEFTRDTIQKIVKHQTEKYNWSFIFLGANQDAVLSGTNLGMSAGSSLTYAANAVGVGNTFNILASGVSCLRTMAISGSLNTTYSFSDEERSKAIAQD
jgi:uncharacterized protein YegL